MNDLRSYPRSGFTLIELLTAMGILVVIVLMMSRVFVETTNAWNAGTRRISEAQEARVIMDFLSREIALTLGDDIISFRIHSESGPLNLSAPVYGWETDSICFVAPTRTPRVPASYEMRRAAPHFIYFVDNMRDENNQVLDHRYRLARVRKTESTHNTPQNRADSAHGRRDWWRPELWSSQLGNVETIAENVAGFEVWAYSRNEDRYIFNYDSTTEGELPLWVDIYLLMLDETTSKQAAALWAVNQTEARAFVERNARRYASRIHFANREGYTR